MRVLLVVGAFLVTGPLSAGGPLPKPIVTGLKNPESVAVDAKGRVYITEIGEFGKDGDGRVVIVDNKGKADTFAAGLDDPKGIVYWQEKLFVADNKRVWRIDAKGQAEVFVAAEAFPKEPIFLNDVAVDPQGALYVSDSGDGKENVGRVFRIDQKKKVTVVTDGQKIPSLKRPNGLVADGPGHVLVLDFTTGELLRVRVADGSAVKVADGFEGGDGLAWDWFGQLFISSWKQGKVWGIARPGEKPVLVASGFQSAADLFLDPTGKNVLVPDMKAGTLTAVPTSIPGHEVDATPLPFKGVPAFPELKWTDWENVSEQGKVVEHRPIFLTHAADGSNRIFVTIQQGTIHSFPNDPKVQKTKVFLDIQKKTFYSDKENEQGLLGLAFHPNYKKNGEFFVFYSLRTPKLTNVLSRFRVSKDDPDKADPDSEEELLRITRPFWNHDGGTICFGPDGYLYVAIGDGGAANDPLKHGQKLKTFFAKILRIDVDRRDEGKKYGIPKDNPFVGNPDAAPEVWAYGLRNVWRMSFDRQTGQLWAGDVGQNLYEEVDIIVKGGNYGWSVREGLHPFGSSGVGPSKDVIDPVWEYHHDVGKSITGGVVYRGKRFPELQGHYLYGDYITGLIWGLKYDDAKKRTVANRPLQRTKQLIFSFGEDEQGEVYYLTLTLSGQGIHRFERTAAKGD